MEPIMRHILAPTILVSLVGCTAPNSHVQTGSKPLIKGPYKISDPNVKVKTMPPLPLYPAKAKSERTQGDVTVTVAIDKDGNTISAKAIDGPVELVPYAESVLMQMKFFPVLVNGKPTDTIFQFTMPFRLR